MRERVLRAACLIAVLASVTACGIRPGGVNRDTRQDAERHALEQALAVKDIPAFVSRDREGARLWNLTRDFYRQRQYELAWIDGKSPKPQMDDLIAVLQKADQHGLDPALYNASARPTF